MPIKWTPEVDQVLLLKILETSQVNADVKAISEAWPENFERPTPRAITERLVKIRANSKSSGAAAHFSVSNARNKSATSTPKKGGGATNVVKNSTPRKSGQAKANGKRKRNDDGNLTDDSENETTIAKHEDPSDTETPTPTPSKPASTTRTTKKPKSHSSANLLNDPVPVSPTKTPTHANRIIKLEDPHDEHGYHGSTHMSGFNYMGGEDYA